MCSLGTMPEQQVVLSKCEPPPLLPSSASFLEVGNFQRLYIHIYLLLVIDSINSVSLTYHFRILDKRFNDSV